MYHLLHKHTGKAVMAVFCLMFISITTTAQTISINSSFNADSEIYPFGSSGTVYGLSINGTVNLYSDSSLVRIVLIDNLFNELLVYEAYQYISPESPFEITNECDETCYSNGFVPYSIQIQVTDASIEIFSLDLRSSLVTDGLALQQQAKQALELQKVAYINNDIALHKMLWFADTNSVSQLSYQQKKALFGDNYNLLGLDYYVGGIYDPTPNIVREILSSRLIPEWDWRDRHGANKQDKVNYYYDGDPNGSGWLTSIKNQNNHPGCTGLCYIYGPLGAIEGLANLYFNHHVDFNLSEQNVLECDNWDGANPPYETDCKGSSNSITNNYVRNNGVVDQVCYPDTNHSNVCHENPFPNGSPQYRIKIEGSSYLNSSETEDIKNALINKGPLICSLSNYSNNQSHSMVLIGYGTCTLNDTLYKAPYDTGYIVIDENSSYLGAMYWKYKNSWGVGNGDEGYMYHLDNQSNGHPEYVTYYKTPLDDILSNDDTVSYFDKDRDGYYNWGIGSVRPQGCPNTKLDSHDSEPRLGPFDENYFSLPVAPVIVVKHGSNTIHQNGVYSFYNPLLEDEQQEVLTFTILNIGTAQLNLIPSNLGDCFFEQL